MNFRKAWKDLAILTVFVVAIQLLLSKVIYPLIPGVGVTQNIFSITPQTALTSTTIGDKIIGVLTGIVSFNFGDLMSWLSLFFGAFLLLFVGYWAVEQRWIPFKGRNIYQRLFAILLYGTIVLYVVLLLTKMADVSVIAVPLLIGVLINYAAIAGAVFLLAKTKIVGKFVRI